MRWTHLLAMLFAFLMTAILPLHAMERPLPMEEAFMPSLQRDAQDRVVVQWRIAPGYYLYRDYLSARSPDGASLPLETPAGTMKDDPGFGQTEVYYASASASIENAPPVVELTYQGCQDGGLCYPPVTRRLDTAALTLIDDKAGAGFQMPQPQGPAQAAADVAGGWTMAAAESAPALSIEDAQTEVDRLLANGGLLLTLAGFLGFGLLLAFTPCVFPMYPVVAAMLAREGESLTARRGFMLAAAYVLALATAFGLFGVAAAWTGQNLQLVLQSQWTLAVMAGLFVLLALSNFGLFEIRLPAAAGRILAPASRRGGSLGGALLLGFSSALIIGPCVTAPLAGALLYIARTGDVAVGAMTLFALGLGKGIPLIVMASLGATALPRAGAWMEKVRQVFGFLFLATALWLAAPLLPARYAVLFWALLAIGFGIFAGVFERRETPGRTAFLTRSAAFVSLVWGVLLMIGFSLGATDPLEPLSPLRGTMTASSGAAAIDKADFPDIQSMDALADYLSAAEPDETTMLYVTADWCVTCRTIERSVFTDPDVTTTLQGMRLAKIDLTAIDAGKRQLIERLAVMGPPTVLFLDGRRREPAGTRLVGDIRAATLSGAAKAAMAGS